MRLCLVLDQHSSVNLPTPHKSAIVLEFEITIPTRRFPAGMVPRYGVANGTLMYRHIPIITRAAVDAIFEGVDVYLEHVGRSNIIGCAVDLECCCCLTWGVGSVWGG